MITSGSVPVNFCKDISTSETILITLSLHGHSLPAHILNYSMNVNVMSMHESCLRLPPAQLFYYCFASACMTIISRNNFYFKAYLCMYTTGSRIERFMVYYARHIACLVNLAMSVSTHGELLS